MMWRFWRPGGEKVNEVRVNDLSVRFSQSGNLITIPLHFQGAPFGQMQQVGIFDPTFSGGTFRGQFSVPGRVFDLLKKRQKEWPIPWTKDDFETTWLAPERLLLFVQIAEPKVQMQAQLKLDGETVELRRAYSSVRSHSASFVGFYADVSSREPDHHYQVELDLPRLRPGQFQGLFFENVESEYTDRIEN